MSLRSAFRKRVNKADPWAHLKPAGMAAYRRRQAARKPRQTTFGAAVGDQEREYASRHGSLPPEPRKTGKNIIVGAGQTPDAGKPRQGAWQAHTHKPGDPYAYQHGPDTHTHRTPTGRVNTVMGQPYSQPRRQSKDIVGKEGRPPRFSGGQQHGDRPPAGARTKAGHTHYSRPAAGAPPTRGYYHSHQRGKHPDVTPSDMKLPSAVGKMQKAFRKRQGFSPRDPRIAVHGSAGNEHAHAPAGKPTEYHTHRRGTHTTIGKADPHGGPVGGQGRLHGHVGPGGETHEHDYGEHGNVKISPPSPMKPDRRGQPGYGSGYSQHERAFGHPASHAEGPRDVSKAPPVMSPHPAPKRTGIAGGVPEKHALRIARQNATMNPAMRGVMGAGDLHEHQGAAHSHPDAWTAHAHKAVRKHYGGEPRTKPLTHPHFGNRGTPGGTQHTHPPEFPAEIKPAAKKAEGSGYRSNLGVEFPKPAPFRKPRTPGQKARAEAAHEYMTGKPAVKKAVRAAVKLAIPTGGDPAPKRGFTPIRDPNTGQTWNTKSTGRSHEHNPPAPKGTRHLHPQGYGNVHYH